MQLNRGAVGGGHACGTPDATQLRCRERELVAQLHELLFPSTPPSPAGGGASWSSSSSADLSVEHCGSPVKAPTLCGRRRGRGSKRVREGGPQEEQKQRGGSSAETKAARGRRKKEGTTTKTIVTTVPDFDGYQWKKYGQKQIEAAQYPRPVPPLPHVASSPIILGTFFFGCACVVGGGSANTVDLVGQAPGL